MSGRPDDVFAVIRADHEDLRGLRFYLAGPEAPILRLSELIRSTDVADERIACEITAS
jgi:CDP-4-dehydro-6-deoxyglucose reductase